VGPKPNIFGLAKPIDTHAKMQEIEKKLHEEKKQDIPLKPIDIHPTSRPPFNQSQSNEKYNDQGAHTDHQRQKFDSSHGVNSPLQPQQSQIKVLLKRGDKSRQEFAPMSDKGNDAASVTSSVNSQRSSRNTRSRVKEQIDAHILSNAEQPKPLMQEEKGPPNKFPINPTQPHSPNGFNFILIFYLTSLILYYLVSDQRPKFGPDPNTNRTPNKEFGPRKPFHPPNDSKGSQFPSQFPPYQGGNNNSRPPPRSNQYHNSHQDSNNKHTTRVWTRRTSQASDQTAGSLSNEKPTRNFTPKQPPNAIDGTTTTSLPDDKNAVASRPPFNKTRQRYAKNRRNKNEVGTGPNITEGQPKNGDDRAANVDLVKEKTAIDEPNPATENKKVSSEPIPTDRTTKESCKNVEKSIEKPDTADSSERSLIDETQRQSSTDTSAGQGNNNGGKKVCI
jgi:hypothetical protein